MVEYVNLKLHLDIFFKVSSNLQKMSWKQSGIKCRVGSHRKFAIFLAHNAESRFLRQKVSYFNVSRQKVSYSSVSRQNIVKHCSTMLL